MRCLRVESIESNSDLCDLEIDGGKNNYVAEGLVVHNTFCQIVFSDVDHLEAFGKGQNIYVSSKGVGGNGLAFKNVFENEGNLYVRNLQKLLDTGLEDRVSAINTSLLGGVHRPMHIFGEIFGGSVQDLKYGLKEPEFRVFDIFWCDDFLSYYDLVEVTEKLCLPMVPVLYRGPFIEAKMKELRDGKTTFGEANIREGIVIKTMNESRHPLHGRKIAKMVSPAYLLRKGDVTEYN